MFLAANKKEWKKNDQLKCLVKNRKTTEQNTNQIKFILKVK